MHFKTFDGLDLWYETYGDPAGTPLALIHGIGADHDMWAPQIESLPGDGYYLIVPDLRGHGASGVPTTFRIAHCARDIYDLLGALDLPQAHLVGVSMGGMIAQQFGLQTPERAASLVIADSLSGVTRPVERFNASLAAFLLKFFPARFQAFLIRNTYQKMGHPQVGRYFSDCLQSMDPGWLLAARQEVNRFNLVDRLGAIRLPAFVLVGDGFGKMAIEMARTTAQGLPHARFQVLPGGGDPSNLLVPEQFNQALKTFLAEVDALAAR